MNPFTELRHTIYNRFRSGADRDLALASELLEPELLNNPVVADLLRARRLSYEPEAGTISGLLHRCPDNFYIRRYLADSLRRIESPAQAAGILQSSKCPLETTLDIAGDAGIGVFTPQEVLSLLESSPTDSEQFSIIEYMASLPDETFVPSLESLVRGSSSEKIQQASWYGLAAAKPSLAEQIAGESSGCFGLFNQALKQNPMVVQTVFYGDPGQPGKGGSGGIGTLVMRLGNALAIDGAVTCTPRILSDNAFLPVQEEQDPGHTLYRFSVQFSEARPYQFLQNRPGIGRAFGRTLDLTGIHPKVVHVRFLDDASLAVVRESRRRKIPCAVTLTPDPHRSLLSDSGTIRKISEIDDLITLHRIWVGDELARDCRGWMAIGRNTMMDVVHEYFPQTEQIKGRSLASVDEGVPAAVKQNEIDISALFEGEGSLSGLDTTRLDAPVILSVGRLAPVKNIPSLVQAWADGLWETYMLVVIGGDWEEPSAEESVEMKKIQHALESSPKGAAGRAVFLSARNAQTIAQLEAWLGNRRMDPYPDLYVAPSLKEEFGLAILEAMSAGMIACAPINGGAKTYIRSGINGFLVNTSDSHSLNQDLKTIIMDLSQASGRSEAIRAAARKTVHEHYSIDAMAREYAAFYRRTLDG